MLEAYRQLSDLTCQAENFKVPTFEAGTVSSDLADAAARFGTQSSGDCQRSQSTNDLPSRRADASGFRGGESTVVRTPAPQVSSEASPTRATSESPEQLLRRLTRSVNNCRQSRSLISLLLIEIDNAEKN